MADIEVEVSLSSNENSSSRRKVRDLVRIQAAVQIRTQLVKWLSLLKTEYAVDLVKPTRSATALAAPSDGVGGDDGDGCSDRESHAVEGSKAAAEVVDLQSVGAPDNHSSSNLDSNSSNINSSSSHDSCVIRSGSNAHVASGNESDGGGGSNGNSAELGKAFRKAAFKGDVAGCEAALAAGAAINGCSDGGTTALMMAASRDRTSVGELLIASSADVEATNHTGITALIMAARNGNGAMVTYLLDHNAEIAPVDETGKSAFRSV
jgi:hypothetical protein